mgnify:CR=1 FL=1
MLSILLRCGERQYIYKDHGRSIDGEDLIEEIPLQVLFSRKIESKKKRFTI